MYEAKMKILVVDDETDVELLFRQKFKKEIRSGDIEFQFAFSAESAIEVLNQQLSSEIVLILSDINMPGMNGLELLKYIKANLPHLSVFMLTAYNDEKNYQLAQEYGADKYITKPLDFNVIKQNIIEYQASKSADAQQ